MHTPSFAEYVEHIEAGDWQAVGDLMLSSANKLASIGCDVLISPDNTIHQALPLIETKLPLPWLHIAAAVTAEALERGFRSLGLTGTRWLVESDVYPEKLRALGMRWVRPNGQERDEIHRIIMEELVYGVFKPESVSYHQRVVLRMKDEGCDAVVLGCTELPLILSDTNSPLPTLDSTRLLARSALRYALQGMTESQVEARGGL